MKKLKSSIKKFFVTFTLIISMVSVSLFSGCGGIGEVFLIVFFSNMLFFSDDEGSLNDALYGIRVTYEKSSIDEDNNYVSAHDEQFNTDLVVQYLNLSFEILTALSAEFGAGVADFEVVKEAVNAEIAINWISDVSNPEKYLDITNMIKIETCVNGLLYLPNYPGEISKEGSPWAWGVDMINFPTIAPDVYATKFCSLENLFKMQVALYCLIMGLDCSGTGYGDCGEYFSETPSLVALEKLAADSRIRHSGVLDVEKPKLLEFIVNNVIGNNMYQSQVEQILNRILEQTGGINSTGDPVLKYPVVASAMVKDYYIKEFSMQKDDEEEFEFNYFTMALEQQHYRSMVFMPKDEFEFNGFNLVFQSTEDLDLTVKLRIHEEGQEDFFLEYAYDPIHISAGVYDELEGDLQAGLKISIKDVIKELYGIEEDFVTGVYNQDTDVKCYGGLLGTGVGDSLFDKFGKPLTIDSFGTDATLASFYKVTKENFDSPANVNFEKQDSFYVEIIFENESNKPFNVGFAFFDYKLLED
ncbi:MAG: hypothetical protein IJW82_05265 [Clostridia bacterium]|nr:hypothetical protein [Clostridia bacterium]